MNEPKNKLIEMAREFYAEGDETVTEYLSGAELDICDLIADFAQHVLDKQWTRVEDGLPEEENVFYLLIYDQYGGFEVERCIDIKIFKGGKFGLMNEKTKPLAWMEIPPYVQPEKEGK